MSERKELRYFEKNFYKSLSLYYAPKFKRGIGKVKGEITPSYGKMPVGRIHFIRKIMPEARMILILRNPVDRMWASTRRTFGKIPGKRLEDALESEVLECFNYLPRRQSNEFTRILDNWTGSFPTEQLFVGFFEEIKSNPQNLLRKVFSFLNVSTDVNLETFPYQQVINSNPPQPIPDKYRAFLENIYEKEIEELYRRFGEPVRSWRCGQNRAR